MIDCTIIPLIVSSLQACLDSFVSLDVFTCPLTTQIDYRDKLWSLLPGLQVLDGYDKDGREVNEDDEEEEGSSDEEIGLDYLQKEFSVIIIKFMKRVNLVLVVMLMFVDIFYNGITSTNFHQSLVYY